MFGSGRIEFPLDEVEKTATELKKVGIKCVFDMF